MTTRKTHANAAVVVLARLLWRRCFRDTLCIPLSNLEEWRVITSLMRSKHNVLLCFPFPFELCITSSCFSRVPRIFLLIYTSRSPHIHVRLALSIVTEACENNTDILTSGDLCLHRKQATCGSAGICTAPKQTYYQQQSHLFDSSLPKIWNPPVLGDEYRITTTAPIGNGTHDTKGNSSNPIAREGELPHRGITSTTLQSCRVLGPMCVWECRFW